MTCAAPYLAGVHHRARRSDRPPRDGEVDHLRQRKEPERYHDDGQPFPEVGLVEHEPHVAGDGVDAHRTEQHTESACCESSHHRARAQRGDHRDAEERHRGDLGEAEEQDNRLHHRDQDREDDCADETAHRRDGIDRTERMRCAPLPCQLVAFQERHLGCSRGLAEEDGRDRVQRVVHAGHGGEHDEADRRLIAPEEFDDERDGERHDDDAGRTRHHAGEPRDEHRHYDRDPVKGVGQVTCRLPEFAVQFAQGLPPCAP